MITGGQLLKNETRREYTLCTSLRVNISLQNSSALVTVWRAVMEKCVTFVWTKQFSFGHCVACCYWKRCIMTGWKHFPARLIYLLNDHRRSTFQKRNRERIMTVWQHFPARLIYPGSVDARLAAPSNYLTPARWNPFLSLLDNLSLDNNSWYTQHTQGVDPMLVYC